MARILRVDGTTEEVTPHNGKWFKLEELHTLIGSVASANDDFGHFDVKCGKTQFLFVKGSAQWGYSVLFPFSTRPGELLQRVEDFKPGKLTWLEPEEPLPLNRQASKLVLHEPSGMNISPKVNFARMARVYGDAVLLDVTQVKQRSTSPSKNPKGCQERHFRGFR